MNKVQSFWVSMVIAFLVTIILLWAAQTARHEFVPLDIPASLIFWYMIWKLLHDKSKD